MKLIDGESLSKLCAKLLGGVQFLPDEEIEHLENCPGGQYRRRMYFVK